MKRKDYGSKKKKRRAEYLKREQVRESRKMYIRNLHNAETPEDLIKLINARP